MEVIVFDPTVLADDILLDIKDCVYNLKHSNTLFAKANYTDKIKISLNSCGKDEAIAQIFVSLDNETLVFNSRCHKSDILSVNDKGAKEAIRDAMNVFKNYTRNLVATESIILNH